MKTLRSVLLALVVAGAAMAADAELMKLIGPEARVVAGVNVEQSRTTPFGQFLFSQMKAEDKDFAAFVAATQFDPRRDLTELLVASAGGGTGKNGLLAVRGAFNASAITALAQLKGGTVEQYAGATLVQAAPTKTGHQGAVALVGSSMAVAGPVEQVKAALDRRVKGPGMDAELAAKVTEVSNQYDAWAVSIVPLAEMAARVPNPNVSGVMKGGALQSIQQVSGGLHFGSVVKLAGEAVTRSEKDATALVDVVRFLSSMALMNRQADLAALAAALEKMELSSSGSVAKIGLEIPEDALEQLILSRPRAMKVQATAVRR